MVLHRTGLGSGRSPGSRAGAS